MTIRFPTGYFLIASSDRFSVKTHRSHNTLCPRKKTVTLDNVRYDRNVKSERILTKLRVLDYEYICQISLFIYLDRIAKFRKKILFITRVISIQILTTKYFSFQYSVTYCRLRRPEVPFCWLNDHKQMT